MKSPVSVKNRVLTQREAEIRSQQIKNVEYEIYFKLPEKDPQYYGRIQINFEFTSQASRLSDALFLDFAGGGTVDQVKLNGSSVEFEYQGTRIYISSQKFITGKNQLLIEFTHPYGTDGFGFHRTLDQADGQYYMYSDFEPYNANKAFPLFDQPDLKAKYTLEVDAPHSWVVIANTNESKITKIDDQWQRWIFPQTVPFSTYLFALIAGPFQKWESKTESGIPLRLFARNSMSKYLAQDVNHWFQVTQEGFKYFEKSFGYPYPFGKYDQILTPDYNHGAMENVGAVTFTERYVFRTQATPTQILNRAETIIHELAHMWFGNLVTMKWWDDLWLNESFATYVSNLAMSKFQDKIGSAHVWQQFSAGNKEWAYREDDYVTTHPIVGKADDTDEALANFDGITYGKGASVLKQLVHFIGEEAFLKGLKSYFKQYEFKNATRSDFIHALSQASGKDLVAWENEWLKSSGTNAVQPLLTVSDGKIKQLILKQFPDEADHKLRPHRTDIGLYDINEDRSIVLRETFSVTYSGSETLVPEASGKLAPKFVFPNVGDHDFVHIVLDHQSLLSLETSLGQVADPHLRQMLWSTIWNMVRHAKLPAQTFLRIAMANLAEESDLAVLQKGLEYIKASFWYLAAHLKADYSIQVENFIKRLFYQAKAASSIQISLFFRYVGSIRSQEAIQCLCNWLNQEEAVPGLKMDQERRWAVISRLAALGFKDAYKLIENERSKDKNDKGIISAMIAEASFPVQENKRLWWNRILEKDNKFEKLSIEKARGVMGVFHDSDHPELTQFMKELFFELLPHMIGTYPDEFNSSFASLLYPIQCSAELNSKAKQFLEENPNLQIGVRRELLKNLQLHQRTLKAREISENS